MTHVVKDIEGAIVSHLGARRVPGPKAIRTRWEYSTDDPMAVQVFILAGRQWVEWVFSRDLLSDGLIAEAGVGDVRICPVDFQVVRLELRSPSGYAAVEFDAETVCDFLQETYDVLLPGAEQTAPALERWLAVGDLGR